MGVGGGLKAPWHGAPKWVWIVGGVGVTALAYFKWKQHQAAALNDTSGTAGNAGTTVPATPANSGTGADNQNYLDLLALLNEFYGPRTDDKDTTGGGTTKTKKKYTTVKGDTLASIAAKLKVPIADITSNNPVHAKHPKAKLPAGQTIYYT
jgi:LysM repeat protein